MRSVIIRRPEAPIDLAVDLPRSKSVSNRALIIASLLGDLQVVSDPGDGADTRVLHRLLRERPRMMDCGAGGTTLRFLLAWASVQEGEEHVLSGTDRLMARPHDDLLEALRKLGADIERVSEGYRVRGRRMVGGAVHFDSPISSQYLSALLLVAPMFTEGLELKWTGTRLSEPYVRMTLQLMQHFGVRVQETLHGITVAPGAYGAVPFTVTADWSSAAFWFETVALGPGSSVLLRGLHMDPLQGDREAAHLWSPWVQCTDTPEGMRLSYRAEAGPWTDGVVDLQHVPDLFQPLAFTLAARGVASRFTGLNNLPLKETDRLRAVADVLIERGLRAGHTGGDFHMQGRFTNGSPLLLDPQEDHRMAMSTAPLALVLGEVTILDPDVVDKSYPGFWEDLRKAGFDLEFNNR